MGQGHGAVLQGSRMTSLRKLEGREGEAGVARGGMRVNKQPNQRQRWVRCAVKVKVSCSLHSCPVQPQLL